MNELLGRCAEIARAAGYAILDVYKTHFVVDLKGDESPVTLADRRAEAIIVDALRQITPDVPIVAEEAVSAGAMPIVGDRFWLVDPLDGTKEFVSRNGEFTVNIALVENGTPSLGVVYAPALGRLFVGSVPAGAFVQTGDVRQAIRCRSTPREGLTVVASRSHFGEQGLDAVLAGRPVAALRHAGSSLKFCMLACGEADLYPRLGRTMEWDTAAGHAILQAAGGCVTDLNGVTLKYGKANFENPHFVAKAARGP